MKMFAEAAAASVTTFLAIWTLAAIALKFTGVPKGFPPFTPLPLLSGVVGGFLGASIVYSLVRAVSHQPNRTFFFISIALLGLSFALPLRLSFTKSARFSGVTPAAQMTLALMHAVVATAAVTFFTRSGKLLP